MVKQGSFYQVSTKGGKRYDFNGNKGNYEDYVKWRKTGGNNGK
jgi:hypothetical protein